MHARTWPARIVLCLAIVSGIGANLAVALAADPMDWSNWRGPEQNRVSRETGLIDKWDPATKENVLWKCEEAAGISSPIVMNGRVYTQVRHKPDTRDEQEKVICLDAETGEKLWENKWNVYLSDVPAERVGWSSVVGDPETDKVYALGVNGYFSCIDGKTGKTLWSRSLGEEFGMISPYGGRTHPPAIFEDMVIVNAVMVGWGENARPAHRILAMDKATGEARWHVSTKPAPEDTIYSTPFFTVLDGQAAMVIGSADGAVWAFQPRTGKPIWQYKLSRRGLNVSPVVVGDKVYISQAEENLDNRTMGSLVCFRGTGKGDLTGKTEVWRMPGVMAGKSSPLVVDGRVYSCDDGCNLYIADAETGKRIGNKPVKLLGTITRASPLYADGKIYLCSLNGWHVMKPTPTGVNFLAKMRLPLEDEITGSLAISHGKIYLPTGTGLYCLGKKGVKPAATPIPEGPKELPIAKDDKPAHLQVVPCEVLVKPGQEVKVAMRLFNERGQLLHGSGHSYFTAAAEGNTAHSGGDTISVSAGDLTAKVRVRVIPPLPWKFDFNDIELTKNPMGKMEGEAPITWVGARHRHKIRERDGEKLMVKVTTIPKGTRSQCWFGPPEMRDYTIQADMCGQHVTTQPAAPTEKAASSTAADGKKDAPTTETLPMDDAPADASGSTARMPDMGLINQRYTLDLMGNKQQLQIRYWPPQVKKQFSKSVPFAWEAEKWYTLKFTASTSGDKVSLRGKVWPRGEAEPKEWTIEVEDHMPNLSGSPGLFGQATNAEIYIDNVVVTANEPAAKK
jgi:outer membrane protein assembly factor BamB